MEHRCCSGHIDGASLWLAVTAAGQARGARGWKDLSGPEG
jgi:hypothetical protein